MAREMAGRSPKAMLAMGLGLLCALVAGLGLVLFARLIYLVADRGFHSGALVFLVLSVAVLIGAFFFAGLGWLSWHWGSLRWRGRREDTLELRSKRSD